jgi:hypothetical protein
VTIEVVVLSSMDPGNVSAGIGSSAPGGDYYWMAPRCIALLLACDQRRVLVSNLGPVRFSAGASMDVNGAVRPCDRFDLRLSACPQERHEVGGLVEPAG